MLRAITCILFAIALAGCSSPSKSLEEVLPTTLNGWTRSQIAPLDAASAPDVVKQLGLKRAISATYTGPSAVTVRVFEMNVSTSAFELIQKWRQQDGLAVYTGPYFVVAQPPTTPNASTLLEGLRKHLQQSAS